MRARWPAILLVISGCSSPSLKYVGTEPFETEVNGRRVDVYAVPAGQRLEVQAIFLDSVLGADAGALREDAAAAIARAAEGTGCRLERRSLRGAATVWEGRLTC